MLKNRGVVVARVVGDCAEGCPGTERQAREAQPNRQRVRKSPESTLCGPPANRHKTPGLNLSLRGSVFRRPSGPRLLLLPLLSSSSRPVSSSSSSCHVSSSSSSFSCPVSSSLNRRRLGARRPGQAPAARGTRRERAEDTSINLSRRARVLKGQYGGRRGRQRASAPPSLAPSLWPPPTDRKGTRAPPGRARGRARRRGRRRRRRTGAETLHASGHSSPRGGERRSGVGRVGLGRCNPTLGLGPKVRRGRRGGAGGRPCRGRSRLFPSSSQRGARSPLPGLPSSSPDQRGVGGFPPQTVGVTVE